MEEYFRIGTGSANLVDFVNIFYESQQIEVKSDSEHPSPLLDRVDQPTPSSQEKYVSPQPQITELKPLPEHLKYAYLGDNQQFLVIIASNLSRE
ncbi:hypothetical protein CR513_16110, partial [Mucuna pruriens]